jgi:hypothetical protein
MHMLLLLLCYMIPSPPPPPPLPPHCVAYLHIQIKAVYMTVGSPGEIQVSTTYPGYPSSSYAHS